MAETTITPRVSHKECFGAGGTGVKFRTTRYPNFKRQTAAYVAYVGQRESMLGDAALRTLQASSRSPQEQLACLDARLGEGIGAHQERTRLLAKIAAQSAKASDSTTVAKVPNTKASRRRRRGDAK